MCLMRNPCCLTRRQALSFAVGDSCSCAWAVVRCLFFCVRLLFVSLCPPPLLNSLLPRERVLMLLFCVLSLFLGIVGFQLVEMCSGLLFLPLSRLCVCLCFEWRGLLQIAAYWCAPASKRQECIPFIKALMCAGVLPCISLSFCSQARNYFLLQLPPVLVVVWRLLRATASWRFC